MADETTTNLFGEPVPMVPPRPARRIEDRAHAAEPGTGPAGETCGSCAHLSYKQRSRRWYKCGLLRFQWTGGYGTDVRRKDAACSEWIASGIPRVQSGCAR